ncbi:MAG: hypothetical protein ACD_60C00007G0008 [uncultured bacterium]|nr:MAG: hypothetical protein ACD_60C00007G0008 [uncultured bacterium]
MRLSDFHYELPEELIARYPLKERSSSRLLCVNKKNGAILHQQFTDLIEHLSPHDLLVCNNTRVIPARLWGMKKTGGRVEILIERILDHHRVLAHVRASKSPKPQSFLFFAKDITFEVIERHDDLFELYCHDERLVLDIIEDIGEIPLPPYFHRAPEESDKERYQTIYAKHKGSVAAPTAGLHFDDELFQQLKAKKISITYVTLHIGAGTFAPIRVEDITKHRMHKEYVEVPKAVCEQIRQTKARGGRVIAVGTTAARSLETASLSGELHSFSGETDIFIYPEFTFRCVDALITNFHLPESTLLMLVSALGGHSRIMAAYQEAVRLRYRFFSYGDAMLIE